MSVGTGAGGTGSLAFNHRPETLGHASQHACQLSKLTSPSSPRETPAILH